MRNQKGITLISLVITIVVLIILAGVAINMTLGENGIFNKAQEAKRMQAIATAKEQIGLEILEAQIEAMENNEKLEQTEVEAIVEKYGELQADGDTIILNDTEYEVSLRDIYNTMAETETDGDTTTELAQLKALLAQTTVTEDKILKDYKAYKDGKLITGTMEDYAGDTQDATFTSDDNYTYVNIPNNGYYTTSSKLRTVKQDAGSIGNTITGKYWWSAVGTGKIVIDTSNCDSITLTVTNWNITFTTSSTVYVISYPSFGGKTINNNGTYTIDTTSLDSVTLSGGVVNGVWDMQTFDFSITTN